jgi:arginase
MVHPSYAIVEAPSVLGLFPKGVETLPDALLPAGLAERLGASRAGRVEAIGPIRARGDFPVVLGGDCSILLGCVLATRREGRTGLLFLDGHADFYQPEAEPHGEAASMDLALVTGRGPEMVTNLEDLRPLVRDEHVFVLGRRDAGIADAQGSQRIEETGIAMIELPALRQQGAAEAAGRALDRLCDPELHGFWIHLDADVLDDAVMPAVDYRMPDGLRWDELSTILKRAIGSGRAVGIDITIFNPRLDETGTIARAFVDALAQGLERASVAALSWGES